jgi:hypothetical protein
MQVSIIGTKAWMREVAESMSAENLKPFYAGVSARIKMVLSEYHMANTNIANIDSHIRSLKLAPPLVAEVKSRIRSRKLAPPIVAELKSRGAELRVIRAQRQQALQVLVPCKRLVLCLLQNNGGQYAQAEKLPRMLAGFAFGFSPRNRTATDAHAQEAQALLQSYPALFGVIASRSDGYEKDRLYRLICATVEMSVSERKLLNTLFNKE